MLKKIYYYDRPRSRKGDAVCADFVLRWHHKEMVSIEIHDHILRFSNVRPKRKAEMLDLIDAIKEDATKKGCTIITYKGELDDARAEILKEYGFKEMPACGLQRFFDYIIKENSDEEA